MRKHRSTSSLLASSNDEAIAEMLANASSRNSGFGGRTVQLNVGEARVFCKMVPLTTLELEAANTHSTANLFNLPPYYQYGIGSTGFGAWRELAAHILASEWVASGEHDQFPLLYHWRIIRRVEPANVDEEAYEYLAHAAAIGVDESSIRLRLEALRASPAHIAIFTECIPTTLSRWLLEQLQLDSTSANAAVNFVEERSRKAFEFMRGQSFIHFDAHLDNILTDGTRLYFADFGLAVHKSFQLGTDETRFLEHHAEYDAARFGSSLVHTMCRAIPGDENWREKLNRPALVETSLPDAAFTALQRHAPTAFYMRELTNSLTKLDRRTIFSGASAFPDQVT
jgi:hypothetical protein